MITEIIYNMFTKESSLERRQSDNEDSFVKKLIKFRS